MKKIKEKELNGTRQENAAAKVKRTDNQNKDDFIMLPTVDFCFRELMHIILRYRDGRQIF